MTAAGRSRPAASAGHLSFSHSWSLPSAGSSIGLIIVAILIVTAAIQSVARLSQNRLFEVAPKARSRLNTALVTNNFIGGAIGATSATLLWSRGGWTTVSLTGAILAIIALILWAIGRRGPLVVPGPGMPARDVVTSGAN